MTAGNEHKGQAAYRVVSLPGKATAFMAFSCVAQADQDALDFIRAIGAFVELAWRHIDLNT
ncbi:MAG: hypothetical protein AAF689_12655 [Pseudomonadota bacterium]